MNYVLDACAIIAFLDKEEGAEIVNDLFEQASVREITLFVHAVNLTEVYYDRLYACPELADDILEKLYAAPLTVLDTVSPSMLLSNTMKATFPVTGRGVSPTNTGWFIAFFLTMLLLLPASPITDIPHNQTPQAQS
jgi:hypothetical protein